MNRLFHISRTFLTVENDMFEVFRVLSDRPQDEVEEWKKFLGADRVFRKEGKLYFCSMVEEATIIEENN